ncbi:unnamed protein product [Darwinula stevensoni]|uniref:YTH domain-containing protein n=1 Tax=Darwinula stevensoni TaxID=69355 RepID=A0A7R9A040_9CRUS|nr:unnamed protein product [Darwinula stevensoni]CAG0883828.1 unnamed protein product [Darwinula stevensoni]
MSEEVKEEAEAEFDTRSEASTSSGSSGSSSTSEPSVSSLSSKAESSSSDEDDDEKEDFSEIVKEKESSPEVGTDVIEKGKRERGISPIQYESPPKFEPPPKSSTSTSSSKTKKVKAYDYFTKLNYLFRDARFFLLKSNNAENITLSKAKEVWSTPPQNEAKLNQAFRECRNVLLLFSVKESGKFAGFARLGSESRHDVPPISWVLPPGIPAKALGGVFQVDWISRKELAFTKTQHLYNPWNEGKPVKIGRDGQEIEPRVAEELCRLFPEDTGIELTPILYKSKRAARNVKPKMPQQTIMRGRFRGSGRRGGGDAFPRYSWRSDRSPARYSGRPMNGAYSDLLRDFRGALPPFPPPPHLPYPPPMFDPLAAPPPRYYDGPPMPDYHSRSRDKRSDFLEYEEKNVQVQAEMAFLSKGLSRKEHVNDFGMVAQHRLGCPAVAASCQRRRTGHGRDATSL